VFSINEMAQIMWLGSVAASTIAKTSNGSKADGAGEDDQFDDVDPALATFNTGHEGLMALKPDGQVLLTEARLDAGVDQCLAECHLSSASDCLCHASHTFCDVAS